MILARRSRVIIISAALVIFCAAAVFAVSAGERAPYFRVTSADGEELTSDMLKGKLAVMFYETKDKIEKNRALKDELNAFYGTLSPEARKGIARLAIIRCSVFFRDAWKEGLRENSVKEGLVIYGDWDGSMAGSYNMAAGQSNFLIIDKSGIVRYVRSGVIPAEDFLKIKKMVDDLK